jgi:hypothetical protein
MNDEHFSSGFNKVLEQAATLRAVYGEQLWIAGDLNVER